VVVRRAARLQPHRLMSTLNLRAASLFILEHRPLSVVTPLTFSSLSLKVSRLTTCRGKKCQPPHRCRRPASSFHRPKRARLSRNLVRRNARKILATISGTRCCVSISRAVLARGRASREVTATFQVSSNRNTSRRSRVARRSTLRRSGSCWACSRVPSSDAVQS